jgi:hypothetical protein
LTTQIRADTRSQGVDSFSIEPSSHCPRCAAPPLPAAGGQNFPDLAGRLHVARWPPTATHPGRVERQCRRARLSCPPALCDAASPSVAAACPSGSRAGQQPAAAQCTEASRGSAAQLHHEGHTTDSQRDERRIAQDVVGAHGDVCASPRHRGYLRSVWTTLTQPAVASPIEREQTVPGALGRPRMEDRPGLEATVGSSQRPDGG